MPDEKLLDEQPYKKVRLDLPNFAGVIAICHLVEKLRVFSAVTILLRPMTEKYHSFEVLSCC